MKKTLIKNLALILTLLVLVTFQVSATYPPVVYLNDLPSTASYVIKTDGTNYWSVRSDGYTSASSLSAFEVINSAITSTMTTGGIVFVQRGTYLSTVTYPTILLKRHVSLLGEGMNSTVFKCGDGVSQTVMYCDFQDSDDYDSIEIGNFKIDGNNANNANTSARGIHIFSLMRARFHDITIINTCATAFYTQGNSTQSSFLNTYENILILYAGEGGVGYGMYFTNYCQDNVLIDLKIAVSQQDGIYFSSSGNREISYSHIWQNGGNGIFFLETTRDKLMNVEIEKNDMCGVKVHSSYDFTMIGCTINSNGDDADDTYPEVMIDCDTAVSGVARYGYNNIINSNHIYDRGPDATYSSYALMMNNSGSGYVGNSSIVGNDFVGYSHGVVSYSATGGNNTFMGNVGFITEAVGSQVTCINGATVTHGLAGTPTSVIVSSSISGEIVTVTAVGSTTFTLGLIWWNGTTVDANHSPCTVYYQATYKP